MAYAVRNQSQVTAASGLDVLAAIWLIISPFVLVFARAQGAAANDVILGIVIGILALIRVLSPTGTAGLSWINVLLGIWVIISPWVVGFSGNSTAMTNNVIIGIIVVILALWSAAAGNNGSTVVNPPQNP